MSQSSITRSDDTLSDPANARYGTEDRLCARHRFDRDRRCEIATAYRIQMINRTELIKARRSKTRPTSVSTILLHYRTGRVLIISLREPY